MNFIEYWENVYKNSQDGNLSYDNWLDKYDNIINKVNRTILDLGCGLGNDTLYLLEKGHKVLSSDYSNEALSKLKNSIPGSKTKLADISQPLPFKDNSYKVIIADLCLHYFDNETTIKIMYELKRILKNDGYLFARVNSLSDTNYGAGKGEKIEDNYYYVDGYNKRFFDLSEVNKYFSIIGEVNAFETDMMRYSKPKKVIELSVKKIER